MTIETATHVSDLNAAYPASGDPKSEGDDHIRLIKTVIKTDVSTISSSLSTVTAANANVSTSLGNVSTSLIAVSSVATLASSAASTAQSGVTSVATSLSTTTSTVSAVSSTVAGLSSAMTFVSSQTASASASITFTGLASGYDYVVVLDGVYPATNGADILVRVQNAGVDDTGGSSYTYMGTQANRGSSSLVFDGSGPTSSAKLGAAQSNVATNCGCGSIRITNPARASAGRAASFEYAFVNSSGQTISYVGAIYYNGASAIDGLKFYASSGNITAGTFSLYKIARS